MLLKRLTDVTIAVFLFCLLVWFIPLIAILVKRDSAGPIFFKQIRVGQNGMLFDCIKLRSMKVGTQGMATHEISAESITKFGRLLRRTKFDEMPQIWNVLRGEMSFVGPRPSLPTQTKVLSERHKYGVMAVKPGISGLAQIHNIDMSNPRKLAAYDALYIKRASICLDIYIAAMTVALSFTTVRKRR
jgi:O-antigen biosynthesis protein WbqP